MKANVCYVTLQKVKGLNATSGFTADILIENLHHNHNQKPTTINNRPLGIYNRLG